MTSNANGVYMDCGFGAPVGLTLSCSGPSCPMLDSFPNLVCTTGSSGTNCNNGVSSCPPGSAPKMRPLTAGLFLEATQVPAWSAPSPVARPRHSRQLLAKIPPQPAQPQVQRLLLMQLGRRRLNRCTLRLATVGSMLRAGLNQA